MKVTIKSKEGLQTHATNSETAASDYLTNISATERQFAIKVEDSYTSAIEKFQEKMNSLSTLLHETFPQSLEKYGETILTYIADVDGAGFSGSQVIKTKDDDIESIKNWLTSTTSKKFETVSTDFDTAFQKVKDVLATEPKSYTLLDNPSKDTITTEIESELKTLADARNTTHEALNTSLTTFISNLNEVDGILAGVNAGLLNAANIGTLSFSDLLTMVKNQQLTAGNMDLIGSIQDSNDVTVLKVLLNEGDDKQQFFTQLGEVKTKHVSKAMMDLVYFRVNQEYNSVADGIPGSDQNMIQYVMTISKQDKKAAKDYFEKLIFAGDRYVAVLSTGARSMMPKLPATDANEEIWKEYEMKRAEAIAVYPAIEQKMARAGVLTGLFESLFVSKVGKETTKKNGVPWDKSYSIENLQFHATGFTYTLSKHNGENVDNLEINSYSYTALDEFTLAGKLDEIKKIREQRSKEEKEYVKDLVGMLIGKLPGGDVVVNLVADSLDPESAQKESMLKKIDEGAKSVFKDSYGKYGGDYVGDALNLVSHVDQMKEYDQAEAKAKQNAIDTFFYGGGRSMTGGETERYAESNMTYDLQAIMARDDLEKNGLRGYYYENPYSCDNGGITSVKEFEKAMTQYKKSASISYEGYEFLTGQDSHTVDTIGIEELDNYLNKMDNADDVDFYKTNYKKWSENIYGLGQDQSNIVKWEGD